jgi:C4-type Zn-finger protein
MDEEQKKEYLEKHGVQCPFCKNDELKADSPEIFDTQIVRDVTCESCGEEWKDVYTLTDVDK